MVAQRPQRDDPSAQPALALRAVVRARPEADEPPPPRHHRRRSRARLRAAERLDAFDDQAFGNRLVELPGGVIQLYVRDPAGNLVELDFADKDALPDELSERVVGLWDFNPQDDEQMKGRLFVPD